MGLGFACLGIAFAAVAGVTAQLTKSARTAAGIAGIVLGVSYLLRAIGDASAGNGLGWLSWLSPVGWWQQTRPYRRRPVVGARAPARLRRRGCPRSPTRSRRGGISPPASCRTGPGPPRPPRACGVRWRWPGACSAAPSSPGRRRSSWSALVVGGLTSSVDSFLTSAQAKDFITKLGGEQGIRDAFLAVELGMAGVDGGGVRGAGRDAPALRGVGAARRTAARHRGGAHQVGVEPPDDRAGRVRDAARRRRRRARDWSAPVQVGDIGQLGRMVVAALVQIPAVWLIIGIVVAAFGLVPRWIVLGWVALAGFVLLGEFGALFNLSQVVMDISPFAHVPRLPGGDLRRRAACCG